MKTARKSSQNLTKIGIPTDGPSTDDQRDFSCCVSEIESVEVIFRNHQQKLIEFIDSHDVILGAVAWFTDEEVIRKMAQKRISIIVQKEDFLRPDMRGSRASLRRAISQIPERLYRYELPGLAASLSYAGSPEVQPFRCVGNINRERSPAMPRMHNKMLIGATYKNDNDDAGNIQPVSVWTGSYNVTYNAQLSFENAVIIRDQRVAEAYSNEWAQILALSEPLDWESDWVEPEYRIGS